jgi:hypothetical protein
VVGVQEALPGLFHWQTLHPKIRTEVDSYWIEAAGVLIDPLVPADAGIEWFAGRASQPVAVLLTNRHHYRDAGLFAQRFGCTVHCSRPGMHEFRAGQEVQPFDFGEALAGGVIAYEVDAICPDESALHIPALRAVAIADGVVLGGPRGAEGQLGFVPDALMDEPEQTKRGLLDAYARLLAELDFEHLLLAHGGPLIGDGRVRLRELIDSGGRTAFEIF